MGYKLTIFFIICVQFIHAQNNDHNVFLTGTIKNFTGRLSVEDISEIGALKGIDTTRTFTSDIDQRFTISFHLTVANYFRIGRNIMYLSPGDNLNVFLDYDNPEKATFSGRGAEENEYLKNTPFPKGGSYLNGGENLKKNIQETVKFINVTTIKRRRILYADKKIKNNFKVLENARIDADRINSINYIPTYFAFRYEHSADSIIMKVFDRCERSVLPYIIKYCKIQVVRTDFLKLQVFRNIMPLLLTYNHNANTEQVKDWLRAQNINDSMQGIGDKKDIIPLISAIKKISTTVYRDQLQRSYIALTSFGNGDIAVNFTALSNSEKGVSLSDYKGKVIYIDLWATWCQPCLNEMPFLAKLKEGYKNNPDVVFISLSLDEDKEKWKKYLSDHECSGIQWLINREKLIKYNIVGIPRFILIDKYFKIVQMHANAPSSSEIYTQIKKLL